MTFKTAVTDTTSEDNLDQMTGAKRLLDEAMEQGRRKAQHLARRGYARAEDCVEDTTYYIKRHPWETVGLTLGAGALLGMLCGWCCARVSARP